MADLSYITEGLRPLAVPIDSLTPDPANARKHGAKNLEAIRSSLVRYGQVKPIAVRKADRVVIAGNGRLEVARELGWTHIAVVLMEGTPEQLAGFALVDNKSAELATWDDLALADLAKLASTAEADLASLGFNAGDLAALLDGDDIPPELADAPPENPDAPTAAPSPAKPARAAHQAPAAAPQRAVAPGPSRKVTDEEWVVVDEAAAAVRAEREDPDMPLGACLRILARRYLRSRQE